MAELAYVNPRKRGAKKRKATRATTKRRRRRNTWPNASRRHATASRKGWARRTRRRRRSNPSSRKMTMAGLMNEQIFPALTGAVGSVGFDMLWGRMPIPDAFKAGPMRHLVKGAGAIGAGMLAGMMVKPQTAKMLSTGILTTVFVDALNEMVVRFMPTVAPAGVGQYDVSDYIEEDMGAYIENDMGEYIEDSMGAYLEDGMGAYIDDELGQYDDDVIDVI